MRKIFEKSINEVELTREDAIKLMEIDNKSPEFYELLNLANKKARNEQENRGYIFVQVGLDSSPCSGNCKFCALGKDNYMSVKEIKKSKIEVAEIVKNIDLTHVDAIFLMTTEEYEFEEFIEVAKMVKGLIGDVDIVANIGDFNLEQAKKLKEIGVQGVYHVVRLREGEDTDIDKETRIKTLDAIRDAGLELYYCIEPIGKEHTHEEIIDEMFRAKEYDVEIMAIMKRVGVEGTVFGKEKNVTDLEMTKIAAVTRLVVNPKKSMNIHEPSHMSLLAGINQLYAEASVNPRDTSTETEKSRGFTLNKAIDMLENAEYRLKGSGI